jgi:hypothetical protein
MLICEFFGARIVLNPQHVASPIDYEINFIHPVLVRCCELRQLALRKLGRRAIFVRSTKPVTGL